MIIPSATSSAPATQYGASADTQDVDIVLDNDRLDDVAPTRGPYHLVIDPLHSAIAPEKPSPYPPSLSKQAALGRGGGLDEGDDYNADEQSVPQRAARPRAKVDVSKMKRVSSQVILNQDKHGKRSLWAKIYLHPAFENGALVLIVINAMWIGFDIDWNDSDDIPKWFFEAGENTFCVMFTLELLVRVLAYRHKEQFFYDPDMRKWNMFDLVLVAFMVVDTWILTYILDVDAGQLKMLSSIRLLRLLRMTRILRMVPELGMMVKSMLAAVRSVASTCVLGIGIMYVFAILLTQWVKSYGSEGKCIGHEGKVCLQDYFGTIALSFLALTQILVFDDTFEVVRPIFKERFMMGAMLILYILLVSFTVLNMLIGIICDIVSETTAGEREKQMQRHVEEIFHNMDVDGSETVTREEFMDGDAIEQLNGIGIETQTSKNVFDILDTDRSGSLECQEFIKMIFKCKDPPKSEDILEVEARVDSLADIVGVGRRAIEVLEKDKDRGGSMMTESMQSRSPWMAAVETAALSASKKAAAARVAMAEKASEEAEYSKRMRSLKWQLGNVLLLAEAGSLSPETAAAQAAGGAETSGKLLMLEDGSGAGPQGAQAAVPPLPNAALMTILRPALRALDARLHALRAECKASGMKNAGNLAGSRGEDVIARTSLQPLDELITEVVGRIKAANVSLGQEQAKPGAPPVRQRDLLPLDDRPRRDRSDRSGRRRGEQQLALPSTEPPPSSRHRDRGHGAGDGGGRRPQDAASVCSSSI